MNQEGEDRNENNDGEREEEGRIDAFTFFSPSHSLSVLIRSAARNPFHVHDM